MAVSLDQIPFDSRTWTTDRWVFQLSEPLNTSLGGTVLVDGRATVPVTAASLKNWIVGYGHKMIGALRVEGDHCELGDCASLLPPKPEPKFVEVVPAKQELGPTHRDSIPPPKFVEFDTDHETPRAKAKHKQ